MSTSFFKVGRSKTLCAVAALFAWVGSAVAQPSAVVAPMAPGFQRGELKPVTPAQAEAALQASRRSAMASTRTPDSKSTLSASSQRVSGDNAPVGPSSLAELARSLKNDANLIYEYVRNNIEYYPVWGVHKGALGAVLDNQGTALDQSLLMVELLRSAGYSTASVVQGQISLTPSMVRDWVGIEVTRGCPVSAFFSAAGTPHVWYYSSGTSCADWVLHSIRLSHFWVSVTINKTAYVFDPSYKPHTLKSALDIATISGYSQTDFLNRARSGSTPGTNSIQGLNRANIRSDLNSMATSLASYLRQNTPSGAIDDLVGGRTITPKAPGPAGLDTPLPYLVPGSTPLTLTDSDITAYKPTLRVQYAGIDRDFKSDDIYGKRLTIAYDTLLVPSLRLDGQLVQAATRAATASDKVRFEAKHWYAKPPQSTPNEEDRCKWTINQCFEQDISPGATFVYALSNGWGPMGRATVDKYRAQLEESRVSGALDGSEAVLGSALATLSAAWIAQTGHSMYLIDRLAKTNSVMHHQVGIAGYNGSTYVDLPGNSASVVSETGDTSNEAAAFYTAAMHGSIFESVAVQQTAGSSAVSTVKLIDKAMDPAITPLSTDRKIYDATSANYADSVQGNLIGCDSQKAQFASLAAAGWRLILPIRCNITENNWTGFGYFQISSSIGAIISGGLAGGFATLPQTATDLASFAQLSMPSPFSTLTQSTGLSFGDPVDRTKGNYLYAHSDIAAGVGGFPHSLAFQRLYSSGARLQAGPLGRGWSHNFNASVSVGSDGFQGMGEDSALDAVNSIVELMVSFDLMKDSAKPLDKMVIATLGAAWFGDQLLNNTVIVRQGLNGEVFVKLPDGTYNPPPGSSARLIKNTDGTYKYETLNRAELAFNSTGKIATYKLKSGAQAKFTYTGADLTKVENSLGRALSFTVTNGRIDSVSDGNSRSVSYAYSTDGSKNLTKFTDATSQFTTFEYDLPGRMTKIFYPSRPSAAFMVNVYDTLGRVQTQTDANVNLYTYYFAGSRSEEKGPGSVSNVSYVDSLGRVLRAIDPLLRETTNTYDGASRLIKTVAPEGNSVEYTYDDATCSATEKRCTHNVKTVTQRPKPASTLTALTSSYTYESTFNKVASSTNPRGKTTDFTYNATHGELETVTAPPDVDGNTPKTTYAYTGYTPQNFATFYLPTSVKRQITATASVTNTTDYDSTLKYVPKTSVVDSGTGNLVLTTAFTYDAIGNLQSVDGPRTDVTDTASFIYDNERRLTQTTNALGKLTKVVYDADGRPVRSGAKIGTQWLVSCTSYTPTGKPLRNWGPALSTVDAEGNIICPAEAAPVAIVDREYDNLDRPKRVTQYLTAAEGGNRVTDTSYFSDGKVQTVSRAVGAALQQNYATYTYTLNGLPETLTDARSYRSTFEYDGFDRRSKLRYPLTTTLNESSTTDAEQYGYDANGNVTSLLRRSGQSVTLGYDNLDRLTSRTYAAAADKATFGYDLLGRRLSAKLPDASGGAYNIAYVWDNAGRLTSTTAGARTLSYQYDAAGNRTRITWPDTAFYVTTAYDALNRPTLVKELGTTTLADYSGYDDLSRRGTVTLGNGTTTGYSYGNQGTLSGITHNLAGTAQDVSYGYARNQAQEIISHSWSNDAYQWKPAYNANRSYSLNGLNQYTNVAGATLGYDTSGNISGDGTWTWAYDTDNQLKSASKAGTTVALAYDAAGRMRQEVLNSSTTTQFLYDGADLVAEYDGSGNLLRRYVHGPGVDEPLAVYQGSGTASKEWLYADHLGSVVATADGAGTSTATYSYGGFGEPNQTVGVRFRYTGQTFMPNLGLYYYKARFYSSVIGRFMQTDPIGTADGLNLYAYTRNNPINSSDPSGLTSAETAMLAGTMLSSGAGIAGGTGGLEALLAGGKALLGGATLGSALSLRGDTDQQYIYATYTRINPVTGEVYSGRTGGYGDPNTLVRQRGLQQEILNLERFAPPVLDQSTTDYSAIRGREQQLIDFNGGAKSVGGTARNMINGISDLSLNRYWYMSAALAQFGPLPDRSPARPKFGP